MPVTVKSVPQEAAPTPEDVTFYKQIWTHYLWGYSALDIADLLKNSSADVPGNIRDYVLDAVNKMKEMMDGESYQSLAEAEFREYLAGSVQIEQELTDLFIQSKADYYQLRSGNPRYPDNTKAMPTSIKELQGLLNSIEKVRQGRAGVLAKLSEPSGGGDNTPKQALSEGEHDDFMASLGRKPQLEDVKDADYKKLDE